MHNPDFVPDPVILFNLDAGLGAFHIEDIACIIPDISKPKTHSLLTTYSIGALVIPGNSADLAGVWMEALGMEWEDE